MDAKELAKEIEKLLNTYTDRVEAYASSGGDATQCAIEVAVDGDEAQETAGRLFHVTVREQ